MFSFNARQKVIIDKLVDRDLSKKFVYDHFSPSVNGTLKKTLYFLLNFLFFKDNRIYF